MRKFCFVCHTNPTSQHECKKNHEEVSFGIEAAGVLNIFNRSFHTRGVCYTKYLGDGDTKSYERVAAGKPCGPNIAVQNVQDMHRKELEQDGGDLCKKREEQGCMKADLLGAKVASLSLKWTNYKILMV
jgi:hypothetical protein